MSKIDSVNTHYKPVVNDNGASKYCLKVETRIHGPYELGVKPMQRNSKEDWEEVKSNAIAGKLELIPPDIFVRHYGNL